MAHSVKRKHQGEKQSPNAAVIPPQVAIVNDDVLQPLHDGCNGMLLEFGREMPPDLGAFDFSALKYDSSIRSAAGVDELGRTIPHVRNEATARIVSMLVACGARPIDIAIHLDIRPGQLNECYRHELEHGAFPHHMQVAKTILDRAKLGDPRFSLFWAKSRMGWREGDSVIEEEDAPLMTAESLRQLVRGSRLVSDNTKKVEVK